MQKVTKYFQPVPNPQIIPLLSGGQNLWSKGMFFLFDVCLSLACAVHLSTNFPCFFCGELSREKLPRIWEAAVISWVFRRAAAPSRRRRLLLGACPCSTYCALKLSHFESFKLEFLVKNFKEMVQSRLNLKLLFFNLLLIKKPVHLLIIIPLYCR